MSRKILRLSLFFIAICVFFFSVNGTASADGQNLKIGEPWIVDGQWSLTITGATETSTRNSFSTERPGAVYIIDYTYQNLGYKKGNLDTLYFDLTINGTIMDSTGRMGRSYPLSVSKYPQAAPIGAICDAQCCIAVENAGPVQITIKQYDSNYSVQSATFYIDDIAQEEAPESTPEPTMAPTPEPTMAPTPQPTETLSPESTIKPVSESVLSPSSTPATTDFDYEALFGDKENYKYDKFDKTWTYHEVYKKQFSDATFYIGIKLFSSPKGKTIDEFQLYVAF